jgi:hypothetical protein
MRDAADNELGAVTLGPVDAAARGNRTILLPRSGSAQVPAGTRSIVVTLTATRAAGSTDDAYADNVKLTLDAPTPNPDRTAPDTVIDKAPKRKSKKRKVKFAFSATEPSSFECKLDKGDFEPCETPLKERVKRHRHVFLVRAKDAAGNVDPTPAEAKFKVRKKR